MSEHHAHIKWQLGDAAFEYEKYPRDHQWEFPGGLIVPASAAPDFMGSADPIDPEEALVAALSSCHMLTFLAIAAKKRLSVVSYADNAVGHLEKNAEGRLCVTRVELHPEVTWGEGLDVIEEQYRKLHASAHDNCFIANSIKSEVTIIYD
jgi:organic hydroperoxide reductase OsmC/OhrA